MGRAENFDISQVLIAGVVNVVRQSLRDIARIAGFEVHSMGAGASAHYGHARIAADIVLPFVGIPHAQSLSALHALADMAHSETC